MTVGRRLQLLLLAVSMLSSCGGMDEIFDNSEQLAPLFECAGNEARYRLHDAGDGVLALEIENVPHGRIGVSTWLLSWSDTRIGNVTGQQGGHQSHVRLSDGDKHFILYEGEDGELAGSPGRTYAGVSVVEAGGDGEPVVLASCDASAMNRALVDSVQRVPMDAGHSPFPDEEAGGPFDGWY